MMNLIITFLAALAGYLVTVFLVWAGTMAITGSARQLVTTPDHRLRPGYKALQQLLWVASVLLGAFVAALAGMNRQPLQQGAVLIAALLFMLWRNTWEARQRGTAAQIVISVLTIAGVIGGFVLRILVIQK